jgi:hypothetical protein
MITFRLPHFATVFLAQFFGILLLAGFGYWWLRWPDAEVWQVLLSFVFAALWIIGVAALDWFSFTRFRTPTGKVMVPGMVALLSVYLVLLAGWYCLDFFVADAPRIGTRLAQLSHLSPRIAIPMFAWFFRMVELLWVTLLLGMASVASARGFGFFSSARGELVQLLRSVRFWLGTSLTLVVAFYLCRKLIYVVPAANSSLRSQAINVGLRFFLAYLIFITAVVLIVWFTGERRTREATA